MPSISTHAISSPAPVYLGPCTGRESTDTVASVPLPTIAPVSQLNRQTAPHLASRAGRIAACVGGLSAAAVLGGVGGKYGGFFPGFLGFVGGLLVGAPRSLGVAEGIRARRLTRTTSDTAPQSTPVGHQQV